MQMLNVELLTESGYIRAITADFTAEEKTILKEALEMLARLAAENDTSQHKHVIEAGHDENRLLKRLFSEGGELVAGSVARFEGYENTTIGAALSTLAELTNNLKAQQLYEEILEKGWK